MEKKKFVVAYHFKAEFEDTTDAGAIIQAATALNVGFEKTKGTAMSVVAVVPIATEIQTPPPAPISGTPVTGI